MRSTPNESKEQLRKKIAEQTEAFLSKGGEVKRLDNGTSAIDPTNSSFIMRRMRGAGKDWTESNPSTKRVKR